MQREILPNEELVENIHSGIDTKESILQLWKQNQGIIHKLANRYSSIGECDDLLQEGFLGLNEAVMHYDLDSGTPFFSYAAYWIRHRMIRYCQNNSLAIRIPVEMSENVRKYERYIDSFFQDKGRVPSDAEISDYLGISGKNLDEVRKASRMRQIKSLDSPVDSDDGEIVLGDMIANEDDIESGILDDMEREELRETLWPMVDELPDLQGNVLKLRYQKGTTIQAAGDALGISYGKARTTEQDALRALRRPSRRRRLEPFLPDTVVSRAYHGSAKSFKHSWTSSTEGAVLKLIGEE